MTRPTFLVVGGQRCGTTWLYHLLDAHPQVFMARPPRPEPKLFVRADLTAEDIETYETQWFGGGDAQSARARGEKSTSYLETPGTAGRIAAAYPEIKILAILRHPLERAVSNYAFSRRNGLETAPLDEAIRDEDQRVAAHAFDGVSAHPFAYSMRSRYADLLEPYRQQFGADHLGLFLYDDLVRNPADTCAAIYRFLEVDSTFSPGDYSTRYNESPLTDASVTRASLEFLRDRITASNRRLAAWLGRDLSHWDELTPSIESLLQK